MRFSVLVFLLLTASLFAEGKIGVVDINLLISKYEKSNSLESRLKTIVEKREKELEDLRDRNASLKKEMQMAGGERRMEIAAQIHRTQVEYKVLKESGESEVSYMKNIYLLEVYDDIKKELASFAKANDYELILRKSSADSTEGGGEAMLMELESNQVLFTSDKADLTNEILKRLNMRFRQEQKGTE